MTPPLPRPSADQRALGLRAGGLGDPVELGLEHVALGVDQSDLVAADILSSAREQVGRLREHRGRAAT